MAIDSAPLSLSVEFDDAKPSLVVSGRVDGTNVYRLVTVLDQLVEVHERCISLDMSHVASIDRAALERLAESAGAFTEKRRRFHLKGASHAVRKSIDSHLLRDILCCESECRGHACRIAASTCRMDMFTLPSDFSCCREARNRVMDLAESAGLSGDWLRDVMLAVGEAITNAVRHGHSGHADSSFTVSCCANPDGISVCVGDSGPGFHERDIPSFEEALMMEHGRGVHCMRAVMDEVSFNFKGGTSVRLVKRVA